LISATRFHCTVYRVKIIEAEDLYPALALVVAFFDLLQLHIRLADEPEGIIVITICG
jgi:hypothetical protein